SPTAVSAGNGYTCALMANAAVECWGLNNVGQLGTGTSDFSLQPLFVGISASAVLTGDGHTCARLTSAVVKCWGDAGLLGNGPSDSWANPVSVVGLTDTTGLSPSGSRHSCATVVSGGIKCWGDGAHGALGSGTTASATSPVSVSGIAAATAVAGGSAFGCAL